MCNQDTVWNSGFKVGNNASFVSLNLTARIFDGKMFSSCYQCFCDITATGFAGAGGGFVYRVVNLCNCLLY